MAKHTAKVGDDYTLKGHCMVKHPDGTVVTSSRTCRFTEPGKYEVIYSADDIDIVTVRRAASTPAPTEVEQEASGTP